MAESSVTTLPVTTAFELPGMTIERDLGVGWLPTQERFRDPTTGKIMRVWVDPADQSRHYVPEDTG